MPLIMLLAAVLVLGICGWMVSQRKKLTLRLGEHLPRRFLRRGTSAKTASTASADSFSESLDERIPTVMTQVADEDCSPEPQIESGEDEQENLAETSLSEDLSVSDRSAENAREDGIGRVWGVSLFVSIWTYDKVLERLSVPYAIEALNEFHEIGLSCAGSTGGSLEWASGSAYFIHWTTPEENPGTFVEAVRCALMLRQEFLKWNEIRKTDGHLPLSIVMGTDGGQVLKVRVGARNHGHEDSDVEVRGAVIGESVNRARALAQIAFSQSADFLVTERVWGHVQRHFFGERPAEAQLTASGEVTGCYSVQGYWGEHGQQIWVRSSDMIDHALTKLPDAPRVETSERDKLWRVNNGTQILGPLNSQDVARALFSLELDFDCECWEEGRGNRLTIGQSGMFGGAPEEGARFWAFDGETLHGPLTEGFLKTGVKRKVFPDGTRICEESTLNGWKDIGDWQSERSPGIESLSVFSVSETQSSEFVIHPPELPAEEIPEVPLSTVAEAELEPSASDEPLAVIEETKAVPVLPVRDSQADEAPVPPWLQKRGEQAPAAPQFLVHDQGGPPELPQFEPESDAEVRSEIGGARKETERAPDEISLVAGLSDLVVESNQVPEPPVVAAHSSESEAPESESGSVDSIELPVLEVTGKKAA